jgi:DNA repair protein RadC
MQQIELANGVCEAKVSYKRTRVGVRCGSAWEAQAVLRKIMPTDEQEHFLMLALDARNQLLAWVEVAKGTPTSCPVNPQTLFRTALTLGATSILISHNHPSGDPEPSADDLALTRRLVRAGTLLGIPILDHIILGDVGRLVSLAERGIVP